MKSFLFLVSFLFCVMLNAQDTIFFRNKDVKAAKVLEVDLETVKYNNFGTTSPLYVASINEIRAIKYPSGNVDTFAIKIIPQTTSQLATLSKIQIFKKKLYYHDRNLTDNRLLKLINGYPFVETRKILVDEFKVMEKYANKQRGFIIGGLALTGAIFGAVVAVPHPINEMFAMDALGGTTFLSSQIIAAIYKKRRMKSAYKIAQIYNEMK